VNHQMHTGRKGESGSLAVFLVVGLVLLGLTAGTVYFVTQRTDVDNGVEVTQQDQEPETEEQPEERPDEERPVEEEEDVVPEPEPFVEDEEDRDEAPAPQAGPSEELPAAGPGEAIMSLIAILGLSYAVLVYARSKQHSRE
jgi:outer membrane biosynthesis protein TonB